MGQDSRSPLLGVEPGYLVPRVRNESGWCWKQNLPTPMGQLSSPPEVRETRQAEKTEERG